jgi:hypothetical protein
MQQEDPCKYLPATAPNFFFLALWMPAMEKDQINK